MVVNDVHSGMNPTSVSAIERPRTVEALQAIVRRAASAGDSIVLSGSRHAMGGQQFLRDRLLVDLRGMDRVLELDEQRGLVRVEAGIQWPALIARLHELQRGTAPREEPRWGIAQKQTGADDLTLGGAVAANIHGRGLLMAPLASDLESITVVDARGELVRASRTEHPELFRGVIGGYGLLGAVADVTLRLVPRRKLRRVVRIIDIEDAVNAAQRRIDAGFIYGDFQFDVDPASPEFLTKGVFSCYQPVPDDTPMPAPARELSGDDWINLLHLAHVDKREAFAQYARHYLSTDGQLYWSDLHQLGVYLDGYHAEVDRRLGASCPGGEMITEVYVPPERLVDFLKDAAAMLTRRQAPVIYGTIRLIQADDLTLLAWARQVFACVIFNLHVDRSNEGMARVAPAFGDLIDLAIDRGGSFYLTYHRFATRAQIERAYPGMEAFRALKRAWDPGRVFASDWHDWLESTLRA
ncbi:MAG: FAD-binding oxidoreductase [Phycisphaerales bacterium]